MDQAEKERIEVRKLLSSELFVAFQRQPTDELKTYWDMWLHDNPDQRDSFLLASDMLRQLRYDSDAPISKEQEADMLASLLEKQVDMRYNRLSARRRRGLLVTVGTLVLLGAAAMVWILQKPTAPRRSFATAVGESQRIALPDGSEVRLYSNSRLVTSDLRVPGGRELWLEGEALVNVAAHEGEAMVVHLNSGELTLAEGQAYMGALGSHTKVVMISGKAALSWTSAAQPLRLAAGERVSLKAGGAPPQVDTISSEQAWAYQQQWFVFHRRPLGEICALLEANYDVQIFLARGVQASLLYSGMMPRHNLDDILSAIASAHALAVDRTDETIILSLAKGKDQ